MIFYTIAAKLQVVKHNFPLVMSAFALSDKQRVLAIFFTLVKDGHSYTAYKNLNSKKIVQLTLL